MYARCAQMRQTSLTCVQISQSPLKLWSSISFTAEQQQQPTLLNNNSLRGVWLYWSGAHARRGRTRRADGHQMDQSVRRVQRLPAACRSVASRYKHRIVVVRRTEHLFRRPIHHCPPAALRVGAGACFHPCSPSERIRSDREDGRAV